jgi:hypothetical protein
MPTSQRLQLTQALRLAAGECAGLPQLFEAPFARLSTEHMEKLIAGFRYAARSRQIILLSPPTTADRIVELGLTNTRTHRLNRNGKWAEINREQRE